jgi:uncharacterized ferredoxin-like protein
MKERAMTVVTSKEAELEGVLAVARAMAVAARTAPKTRGVDAVETLIVFGEDLEDLARAMETHGGETAMSEAFKRDADCIRQSHAVVLIGLSDLRPKKVEKPLDCGACGHVNCAGFLRAEQKEGKDFPGPTCLFQAVDLGISLASAAAVAARFHVDNRIMYTIGGAAVRLRWLDARIIIGIPLSSAGKNIYFDRDGK